MDSDVRICLNLNPGISTVNQVIFWPAQPLGLTSCGLGKGGTTNGALPISCFKKKTVSWKKHLFSLQLKLPKKFIPPKPTPTTTVPDSKTADFRVGNLVGMHLLNVQVLPPADLHHLGVPTCLTKSLGKVWLKHTKVLY